MIFNEASFFLLFLAPSVAFFHAAGRLFSGRTAQTLRALLLTCFGAGFFVYFGAKHFGGLWGALAILIFVAELLVSRLYRRGSAWCVAGVVQAIAVLAFFKYSTFASEFVGDLAELAGFERTPTVPRLLLPLGISFFTFEFIHVAADVYRGKLERPPLASYAAFIFFFPTLVAGPIKRYQDFGPELACARFEPELFSRGITRIAAGLFKKHVFADTFTLFSDKLLGPELAQASPLEVVGWVLAYGMKIYFDFSAYSDIAIGSGYLFGIHLPENFDWPYFSTSIREFWRRWHISLSSWIFDYIYAPLGGSRRGGARTAVNLLITFGISGLWHGAAYNFVLWGLWHGFWVAVNRVWSAWPGRPQGRLWRACSLGLTFACVMAGWALFCMDMERIWLAARRLLSGFL